MRRLLISVLSVYTVAPAAAQTCELPSGQKVESARYVLSYRTQPAKLAVGQHFLVELSVCAKGG